MLQKALNAVRDMFARPLQAVCETLLEPALDCEGFSKLTHAHPMFITAQGSMGQAHTMAHDALAAIEGVSWTRYDRWLPEQIKELHQVLDAHGLRHDPVQGWCKCKRRWEGPDTTADVGPLDEVSRLFGPEHFIGFEIHTGLDGWALEDLELLDSRLQVLRHHGRVVGIQRGTILRMESNGHIHYD